MTDADPKRTRHALLGWIVAALLIVAIAGSVAAGFVWPERFTQLTGVALGGVADPREPRFVVRRDGAVITLYPGPSKDSTTIAAIEEVRLAAKGAAATSGAADPSESSVSYVIAEIDNTSGTLPQTVDAVVLTDGDGGDVAYASVHLSANEWMHSFVGVDSERFRQAQALFNQHAGERTVPPGARRTVVLIAGEPALSPRGATVDGAVASPTP